MFCTTFNLSADLTVIESSNGLDLSYVTAINYLWNSSCHTLVQLENTMHLIHDVANIAQSNLLFVFPQLSLYFLGLVILLFVATHRNNRQEMSFWCFQLEQKLNQASR